MKLEIRKYRKYRRMTQKDLAIKSNLSQSYLSMLENNKHYKSPTLTVIESISKALQVCPVLLLGVDCNNCITIENENKKSCKEFLVGQAKDRLNFSPSPSL